MIKRMLTATVLVLILLTACGGGAQDGAAEAVEDYLQALVAKDETRLTNLSCAEWELQAVLEMDSFEAVAPQLEGVKCKTSGSDGETSLVDCEGKIVTTYDGEVTELELNRWTYQVVQHNNNWLVCGYR